MKNAKSESKPAGLHILRVVSEAGDEYGPFVFLRRIDGQELFYFLKREVPGEMDGVDEFDPDEDNWDGPGWAGGRLHLEWTTQARPFE